MKLVFDDSELPGSSDNGVSSKKWFDLYGDVAEELLPNMPYGFPRGRIQWRLLHLEARW